MPSPQIIILIGLPSSGKSEVGRFLAQKLKYKYIDTDSLIIGYCIKDNDNITTIQQCFTALGENEFRKLEKKLIKEIFDTKTQKSLVISTGGGAIIDPDNRNTFKANGTIVFIDTPLSIIKSRIQEQPERPLIGKNKLERLDQLNADRRPIMENIADIRVDGNASMNEICSKIISQF